MNKVSFTKSSLSDFLTSQKYSRSNLLLAACLVSIDHLLYNPDHKIDLKFMLAEQKERNPRAKFTRAKTLGYFYESQQIAQRIISYKYQMSHRPTAGIIRTTAEKFQQSQGFSDQLHCSTIQVNLHTLFNTK